MKTEVITISCDKGKIHKNCTGDPHLCHAPSTKSGNKKGELRKQKKCRDGENERKDVEKEKGEKNRQKGVSELIYFHLSLFIRLYLLQASLSATPMKALKDFCFSQLSLKNSVLGFNLIKRLCIDN